MFGKREKNIGIQYSQKFLSNLYQCGYILYIYKKEKYIEREIYMGIFLIAII